jgi:hypothetical protein
MFETWDAHFDPKPYRVVDPPMRVTVRFGEGFARRPGKYGPGGLPLRVVNEGLNIDDPVEGRLHAWARLSTGEWLCLLEFRVPTGNGRGFLEIRQWCPAQAATPRQVPP